MDEHVKNLHGKSNFVCTKCVSEEEGFNSHLKTHDVPKESVTLKEKTTEAITIMDIEDLPEEMNGETNLQKCNFCTFTFPDILDLTSHIEIAHPNVTTQPKSPPVVEIMEEVTCRECQFEADSADNLKTHMKTHTWICCEICSFKTKLASDLSKHV